VHREEPQHPGRLRMRHRANTAGCLLLLNVTILCFSQVSADTAGSDSLSIAPELAVLPPINHTGQPEALNILMPKLYNALAAKDIAILRAEDLRPLLRRLRSRSVGRIGRRDASVLHSETGVSYLLAVSLDFLREELNPESGLTLRLLDLERMRLVWARSSAATGEDFSGIFGTGRIDSVNGVADRIIEGLVEDLSERLAELSEGSDAPPVIAPTCVALVPLDDGGDYEQGGDIVSGILISEFLRGGFDVVEPGFIREFSLGRQRISRGAVLIDTVKALHEEFGVDFVITGAVEHLHAARGGAQSDAPELSFGLRLLDARQGRLLATFEEELDGDDFQRLFRIGRVNALGELIRRAAARAVDRIEERVGDRDDWEH
jgi:hypothetical protein